MRKKLFNNLLLFSLFGIALGFFGMLYEGVVTIPKMLDTSMARMLFWKDFYAVINPLAYYIPFTPLATVILIFLFFNTTKEKATLRKLLGWAGIMQTTALVITFCIVKQINLKMCFGDIAQYADAIPDRTVLVNILSGIRLVLAATALSLTFKGYMQTQKEQN